MKTCNKQNYSYIVLTHQNNFYSSSRAFRPWGKTEY